MGGPVTDNVGSATWGQNQPGGDLGQAPGPGSPCPAGSVGKVHLEAQGHLFKVSVPALPVDGKRSVGKRGKVKGFSRKSRKRLLEMCARLEPKGPVSFITLTYPDPIPTSQEECKRHRVAFEKRLQRRFPRCATIWRYDTESSGQREHNPHFHLLAFNLPYIPKEKIKRWWSEVIGRPDPFTRVEVVKSWRAGIKYIAKYIAKESIDITPECDQVCGTSGLDYMPYLDATGEQEEPDHAWTGRVWGIVGRVYLPFAALQVVSVAFGSWFYDLRRSARRVWDGVSRGRWKGFTLFRDDPGQWMQAAAFYQAAV